MSPRPEDVAAGRRPVIAGLGLTATRRVAMSWQRDVGLTDLSLLSEVQAVNATADVMVQAAALAVKSGSASVLSCVFGEPLKEGKAAGPAYGTPRTPSGWGGLMGASGFFGPSALDAMPLARTGTRTSPRPSSSGRARLPSATGWC